MYALIMQMPKDNLRDMMSSDDYYDFCESNALALMSWDHMITWAWQHGDITIDELAWEHIRLIEESVAIGQVPWDAADFSELHNYVDANEYTIEVQGCDMSEAGSDLANAVQTRAAELMFGNRGRIYDRHILSFEAMPDVDWGLRQDRTEYASSDMDLYLARMGDLSKRTDWAVPQQGGAPE